MAGFGKILLIAGLAVAGMGLLLLLTDKVGWIGKLPGDITVRRENFTFHFPIVTCVLVSIVLSLLFWLFRK
ncbi:MAG TPA: DUF2905 domain-containing protein [Deltaproteobacteria bacterium]|nr:MAG: hypothetical protein A2X88_10265 [Deltaproteobacteria bacterium GWC2_65_14]HBO69715.1 DUF2905 domain-containing protein [Deltaproteobacteria bacterium]